MRVIRRQFYNVKRADEYRIVPIGDVHIGSKACDEGLFRQVVKRVQECDNCYWIGMGDYADFINLKDKRFDPAILADWLTLADLNDLAAAQRDRFLGIVEPIAGKCLALVEGNHERTITRHYERAIYAEIVSAIKGMAGIDADDRLGLGFCGWLVLSFFRGGKRKRAGGRNVTINLHHGFVGGRLAGAKALNMQRWLWSHDCDIAVFGHSHNQSLQKEAVERVNRGYEVENINRYGCYAGTFLKSGAKDTDTYSEIKGYFPLPVGGRIEIILRPHASDPLQQVRIMST